jgi:hypothetical protein
MVKTIFKVKCEQGYEAMVKAESNRQEAERRTAHQRHRAALRALVKE